MRRDIRLTPLLKKVKNIRQYEFSGRTGFWGQCRRLEIGVKREI